MEWIEDDCASMFIHNNDSSLMQKNEIGMHNTILIPAGSYDCKWTKLFQSFADDRDVHVQTITTYFGNARAAALLEKKLPLKR